VSNLIRARQPGLTRLFPHNGNNRFIIPRAGVRPLEPIITPNGGAVASGTNVTIVSPQGYPCYYVTDQSLPGEYFLYEGPIAIVGATTIKAVSKASGGLPSQLATAAFSLATDPNFVRWEFAADLDGWFGAGSAVAVMSPPGTMNVKQATGNPAVQRTIVTSGQTGLIWRYIKAQYSRVTSIGGDNNLMVRWQNENHAFQDSISVSIANATVDGGGPYNVTFDMWSGSNTADWQGSDVLGLQWYLSRGTGRTNSEFNVDWIEARKDGFP